MFYFTPNRHENQGKAQITGIKASFFKARTNLPAN